MAELTAEQREELRARLDRREAELRDEIRAKSPEAEPPPSGEPHNQVEDSGEQGEERFRKAVAQAEQDRDVEELRQIAAAKERMARGEYGICIACGSEIPVERLQAQPAAARCLPCQQRFEQTHDTAVRIPPLA
jgi:RNA polymerase-binding protein DksA|nr:TraR/DksA family transcriptional regulator [Caldimonas sp.]